MEDGKYKHVPEQQGGVEKDLKTDLLADDVDEAGERFVLAKDRLLNVNAWQEIAVGGSAAFQLSDAQGNELHRHAHNQDLIRIKIPAPGNRSGQGYDWVRIEALEYDDYPDADYETFAMRVRPCANPEQQEEGTAHFFSGAATSTFVIERRGRHLTAHYFGRNEHVNKEGDLLDDARNLAVSLGAWLIGSDAQWMSLIKGFLK